MATLVCNLCFRFSNSKFNKVLSFVLVFRHQHALAPILPQLKKMAENLELFIETEDISFVYIFLNFCLDTCSSLLILDDFYKIKI